MHPRVRAALAATKALGIPDSESTPVLKRLLKLYDKKWELIEENNYQTLIDSYYEGVDDNDKRTKDVNERQSKRQEVEMGKVKVEPLEDNNNTTVVSGSKKRELQLMDANGSKRQHADQRMMVPKVENDVSGSGSSVQRSPSHPKRRVLDITKGTENVKIALVDEMGVKKLPIFNYIPHNIVFQEAHVSFSLARISDEDCCSGCSGNCLSTTTYPCACARETGGEFAYTEQGQLKEDFLEACVARKTNPQKQHYVFCQCCPEEKIKNEYNPDKCKGHLVRKFVKECWRKCGCDLQCGNRVVQRGIKCNLQVFWTRDGKGWGVRTVEELPKGTFVCEYIGEIVTNMELYNRNMQSGGNERHTYPVLLDADWGSERVLQDEDALCLDATYHGNVARFINHRCFDANLIDIPVEIETPDRHYYHLAFFTTRKINAYEELTWDYGIDFDDHGHPVKAFRCSCRSKSCRDINNRKDTRRS